jgi:hypothetical protein
MQQLGKVTAQQLVGQSGAHRWVAVRDGAEALE